MNYATNYATPGSEHFVYCRNHHWDTRRCIDFQRYRTAQAANDGLRWMHGSLGTRKPVLCPHCNAWHLAPTMKYRLGGWTPEQYIANLPPLFEPVAADTSRIWFNLPESRA